MEKFKILDHGADLEIKALGKDEKELFLNMALGMESAMQAKVMGGKLRKSVIELRSVDLPALLVDFLNKILYEVQTNKEIYNNINFEKFTDTELKADLSGEGVESFGEDIKAATYHDLTMKKLSDGTWTATVVFDV